MSPNSGSSPPRTRPGPAKPLVIALAASVAIHGAIGAYLAVQRFTMPDRQPLEDLTLQGQWFDPPRPKPPPPKPADPRPPKPRASSSRPDQHQTSIDPDLTVDTTTLANENPPPSDQGPVRLTTEPSEGLVVPPRVSSVIQKPEWIRKPTSDQVSRAYPDRALRRGVSGEVMLSCQVTSRGAVQACAILTETPEDYGFGAAALRLSRYFLLRPLTQDGRPTDNGVVTIPVRFNLG